MPELPPILNNLLSPEDCAQIDQTLLPTRDRFSIRLTIYCWRYLQQMSETLGRVIADLSDQQIAEWMSQDPRIQTETASDPDFSAWFSHLVISSVAPLQTIAQQAGVAIESLTMAQIIHWYEVQVNARIESDPG
jgi:hypothetical protein